MFRVKIIESAEVYAGKDDEHGGMCQSFDQRASGVCRSNYGRGFQPAPGLPGLFQFVVGPDFLVQCIYDHGGRKACGKANANPARSIMSGLGGEGSNG